MLRLAFVNSIPELNRWRAPARRGWRYADLSAVMERDDSTAQVATNELGARGFCVTIDQLLSDFGPYIDAVMWVVPYVGILTHARRVARAGKHVLLPLTICLSPDEANELAYDCRRDGVQLHVWSSDRFRPSIVAVKQALEKGHLGDPGLLRIHRWSPTNQYDAIQLLVRDLDLAGWLFNSIPTTVHALRVSNDDHGIQVHLGFADGGMALIDCMTHVPSKMEYYSLSLIGSRGAAYADDHHNVHLALRNEGTSALVADEGPHALIAMVDALAQSMNQTEPVVDSVAEWQIGWDILAKVRSALSSSDIVSDVETL